MRQVKIVYQNENPVISDTNGERTGVIFLNYQFILFIIAIRHNP